MEKEKLIREKTEKGWIYYKLILKPDGYYEKSKEIIVMEE